ncbi:MAG: MaoC family dehydratase [Xanthomonadales bacterium]|nr:MaoC family dehydratase [Xanthomonadales bacterium]
MMLMIDKSQLPEYIGKALNSDHWLKISQERINQFAEITEDRQFIHINPERAANTAFGGTVAHGMLTLSLLPYFYEQAGIQLRDVQMQINYGFDKIRFLAPVKVNNEISASFTLLEFNSPKPAQIKLKFKLIVTIKGKQTPALIGEWLALIIE